jgi:hypothetical protein
MPDYWGTPGALIPSDNKTIFADAQRAITRLTPPPPQKYAAIDEYGDVWHQVNVHWNDEWVVLAVARYDSSDEQEFTIAQWESFKEFIS